MEGDRRVRRLIPIAWPLIEVEHSLKVRLEEPLNLVERFVLEAIARFGPITEGALCELMGLDDVVVRHVLRVLERFQGVVSRSDGLISGADDLLDRCGQEQWSREVIQCLAFAVNGPTGGLAPPSDTLIHPKYELHVDPSAELVYPTDASGEVLDRIYWIAPSNGDAQEELRSIVRTADPARRKEIGVPEGAFDLAPNAGRRLRRRWVLSWGVLGVDDEFTVHPAGQSDVSLLSRSKSQFEIFQGLLRRGDRTASGFTDELDDQHAATKIPDDWTEHASCSFDGDHITISLRAPERFDHWQAIRRGNGGEEPTHSREPQATIPRPLWEAIGREALWHPYHFTVGLVVPGDSATARIMLLQRALIELDDMLYGGGTPADLKTWWGSFQDAVIQAWPPEARPDLVSLSALLSAARLSPNPDLVELALDCQ